MENRQQQILDEIKSLMESIRTQVYELETRMSELQNMVDPEAQEMEVIDMEISPDPEFYQESVVESEPVLEPEPVIEPEPVQEPEPVIEPEPVVEPEPVDDLPFFDDLPAAVPPVVKEDEAPAVLDEAPAVLIDAMTEKQAWRTDMPGSPVKDIRLAISLNDRILFINFLFNEDPMAFQDTLTKLNSMPSFDEAASYIMSTRPDWDWESDTVYRFMMALRRRLQ